MDVLLILKNSTGSGNVTRIYFGAVSTGLEFIQGGFPLPTLPVGTWHDADRLTILDFNGDGRSDIMVTDEGVTEIFTIRGVTADLIYQGGFPTKWHLPLFGDFNGDHKTDMLVRQSKTNNNAQWEIAISNGVSFNNSNF